MLSLENLRDRVDAWVCRDGAREGVFSTPLNGLLVLRHESPYPIEAIVYHPLACLILQGEKETISGEHGVQFGPGDSLVVSHELPVLSRVTKATQKEPYLAIVLTLDLAILRSLEAEIGGRLEEGRRAHALETGISDPALVDSVGRYFELVDRPKEAIVMEPLILREIHFRLLLEGYSATLRQLLRRGSYSDRIGRAIGRIKQGFASSLTVPDLAKEVGMSSSLFYAQFKNLTSTTPLQYQKDLRLIAARRMLVSEGTTVSDTAFRVGYESPTQFSREYSRKYGESPLNTKSKITKVSTAV